jgi:cell wall-associated NlpC family hydrolase
MKKQFLSICLTGILAASVVAAPAQAMNLGGATLTTGVRLRSGPGTDSEIITTGYQSEPVIVTADSGTGWYEVIYNGVKGYMSSQYLKFSETLSAAFGKGTVQGNSVRLRSAPSTSAAVLGGFDAGATMDIIGVSGNWYQVRSGGQTGYVSSDYMTVAGGSDAYAQTLSADNGATAIINTAKELLDTRYIYGGTTTNGFDCSGYIQYVFNQHDISLQRTAAQQYTYNGTSVAKSDLQPGDLVFFSSSSQSVGHVGMYVGDGQFIHSSSGAGKVIITSLNTSYYVSHYVGAKRVL